MREAWTVEAVRTVPAERRAAAGDADELFAYTGRARELPQNCRHLLQ